MTPSEWDKYYQITAKRNKGEALTEQEAFDFIKYKATIRRAEGSIHWDFQKLKEMRNG